MSDVERMFENLNAGVVACDADFAVTYANEKYRQMAKALLGMEGFVGNHLGDCHSRQTMEKIEKHFAEYSQKKRNQYHYTMDIPDGKLTIVIVPFYEEATFAGAVEFVFEGPLA